MAAGHVDAIARTAARLDEPVRDALVSQAESLVAVAATSTVDAFERHVADLARRLEGDGLAAAERLRAQRSLRRWTDRETGMCHTHLTLDPEADARLSASLDAAIAAERAKPDSGRSFDQLRADAFVTLVTSRHGAGRRPAQVSVLIDHATLVAGLHERSVCETSDGQPLTPDAVRRLACDAELIPTVLDSTGAVLDQGRVETGGHRRPTPRPAGDVPHCGHPDCTVRFADCEIHHVIEWIHQHGPTDLANLLPLCNEHHHLVHDAGWHLTLHPDRTITLQRPDHSVAYHGSSIDVAPTGLTPTPDSPTSPTGRTVDRRPGPSRRTLHPRRMTTTTHRHDRTAQAAAPTRTRRTATPTTHFKSLLDDRAAAPTSGTATETAPSHFTEPLQRSGGSPVPKLVTARRCGGGLGDHATDPLANGAVRSPLWRRAQRRVSCVAVSGRRFRCPGRARGR